MSLKQLLNSTGPSTDPCLSPITIQHLQKQIPWPLFKVVPKAAQGLLFPYPGPKFCWIFSPRAKNLKLKYFMVTVTKTDTNLHFALSVCKLQTWEQQTCPGCFPYYLLQKLIFNIFQKFAGPVFVSCMMFSVDA